MKRYYKNYDKYNDNLSSYNYLKMNNSFNISASEVPVNTSVGYIELYLFTDKGQAPIENAKVTIYARQGEVNVIPVMKIESKTCPFTIELPIAHPLGTLIKGPEYYFTTYDLTIEKEGFYSITVKNIRLFPGITVEFSYNLNKILPDVPGKQETISIPKHPRDIIQ